jgi:hypothetical protein
MLNTQEEEIIKKIGLDILKKIEESSYLATEFLSENLLILEWSRIIIELNSWSLKVFVEPKILSEHGIDFPLYKVFAFEGYLDFVYGFRDFDEAKILSVENQILLRNIFSYKQRIDRFSAYRYEFDGEWKKTSLYR